jgi:hypothetical protein
MLIALVSNKFLPAFVAQNKWFKLKKRVNDFCFKIIALILREILINHT